MDDGMAIEALLSLESPEKPMTESRDAP